ncbi:SIS domain-containing protein [Candidatus Bathyarchaeota archaeon]|nr:SIS domain-containing protein [Candidatus Bathyarchaeota archaeon]
MTEAVGYLMEETYRPEWLRDGVMESTLNGVIDMKPEIVELGKEIAGADRFYLVGSGGSYSVQFPVRYVAEKYTKVPVHQYSGWEFLERKPVPVDGDAACIFISQSGKTKEVVRGLEWANTAGALTLGLAQMPDSPLCTKARLRLDHRGRAVTIGKLTALYILFGTVLREKGYEVGGRMIRLAESLPKLLPSMVPRAKEFGKEMGLRFKDDDEMFVLGGGVNWGLAYQYAVCTLQEMCWVHATPINYSEFRHGPIEVFSPGRVAIFLRGRGGEAEIEDAVVKWCFLNGVRGIILDSQELDVDDLLTPFTLFVELEWLSYYLSLAKNRDMSKWRYYDKAEF